MKILLSVNKFQFDKKKRNQSFLILEKPVNIKKDNKYLIGMELRETERNYHSSKTDIHLRQSLTREGATSPKIDFALSGVEPVGSDPGPDRVQKFFDSKGSARKEKIWREHCL
jgi:hypothetical protein